MNIAKHRIDDLYLSRLTADLFYEEASRIMEEHAVRCASIVIDMPLQYSEPADALGSPYSEPDIIFRPRQKNGTKTDEDCLGLENEKPTLSLYRWESRLPRAQGNGDIIVMAESLDQARDFARLQGRKYIHEHNSLLEILRLNKDPEYDVKLAEELQVLEADLSSEPELLSSGVVLVRGS
ncbi:hypothetical protein DIT71_08265 [Marinobacter vulgaris]|uniref:Uncharacterized protein n=1 Tax=Marinobacter vulgaris TaxID=1928331 RepID=A0A2V3ZLQ4_9GAMM|nr:hypothetical protein [Marinobacter vulgaris]PXX91838.1 hypothetical protein DIT71_08265 [Marinobacter vulgaris]TSJ70654.1 hypothetical protein FPC41_07105 [Marinobacter vulgaris]